MYTHNKLQQYALLSAAFLATHNAAADVVYTNLEPDIELIQFDTTAKVDVNNDGLDDFEFWNWNKQFATYNSYGEKNEEFNLYVQWVGPDTAGPNRIAGSTYSDYVYNVGVFVYYYPYMYNSGDVIAFKPDIFSDWYIQSMAFKKFTSDNEYPKLWDTGGFWAPGADEKFLGIYFADAEEKMHYGWIRCTIVDTAAGIIIHDYAYESVPDKPIVAGATFGDADLIGQNNYVIYSNSNTLYVYANTTEFPEAVVEVFNLAGQKVFSAQLTDQFSTFSMDLPRSVYIAQVREGERIVGSEKFQLQ